MQTELFPPSASSNVLNPVAPENQTTRRFDVNALHSENYITQK